MIRPTQIDISFLSPDAIMQAFNGEPVLHIIGENNLRDDCVRFATVAALSGFWSLFAALFAPRRIEHCIQAFFRLRCQAAGLVLLNDE